MAIEVIFKNPAFDTLSQPRLTFRIYPDPKIRDLMSTHCLTQAYFSIHFKRNKHLTASTGYTSIKRHKQLTASKGKIKPD